jgi:hypothetical protein
MACYSILSFLPSQISHPISPPLPPPLFSPTEMGMLGAVKHFRSLRDEVTDGRRIVSEVSYWVSRVEGRLEELEIIEEETRRLTAVGESELVAERAAVVEEREALTVKAIDTVGDDIGGMTVDIGDDDEEEEESLAEEEDEAEDDGVEKKSTFFSVVIELLTGVDIYMEPVMLERLNSFCEDDEVLDNDDITPPVPPVKENGGEVVEGEVVVNDGEVSEEKKEGGSVETVVAETVDSPS